MHNEQLDVSVVIPVSTRAGYRCVPNPRVLAHYRAYRGGATQLSADPERLGLAAYAVLRRHSQAHPEVFRRGPDFDRQIGELLLESGDIPAARYHFYRLWRARPVAPSSVRLLARALLTRKAGDGGSAAAVSESGSAADYQEVLRWRGSLSSSFPSRPTSGRP